jgi:hypothetical protein
MPPNSPDAAIKEVIGSESVALVTSAWLFDDSAFAAGVRQQVEELIAPRYRSVIRLGSMNALKEATDPLFAGGFHLAIQPLTLMEKIPGLCHWVGENTDAGISKITQSITAFEQARPGACWHVVMALGADLERARALQSMLRHKAEVVLLSPGGTISHSLDFLAQATAAYGYSVWLRYWEQPERNLAKAMWRPPGEGPVTIGLSVARLNVDYHTKRWQERLCDDQLQRWLKPQKLPAGTWPETTPLVSLLRHLLPEWYLTFTDESKLPKLPISSPEESAMIAYRSPADNPTGKGWWQRVQFRQWMVRLRAHVDFLGFVAFANCRRFLERQSRSLFSLLTLPIRSFLSLPREPEGLVSIFRARLRLCSEYASRLAQVRIADEAQPRTSFENDWKSAVVRVSAIPHLVGALSRCGLIAIGLAWLVIGPWLWLGVGKPLTDQTLSWVTLASAIVLGICVGGVFVHYFYASLRAANTIERALRNVEVRHLSSVGVLAIEKVRGAANELEKQLQAEAERLDKFEDEAKKQPKLALADPATVGPDNLSLGAIDHLLDPAFDAMQRKLYENFRLKLLPPQDEQFLQFDYQFWMRRLTEEAGLIARAEVETLHYEDCAAQEKDADSRLGTLLSNMVKEGSSPALAGVPADPCANVVLFGHRELWEPHRGHHDRIGFYPLLCRDLLLLSVHSIPT